MTIESWKFYAEIWIVTTKQPNDEKLLGGFGVFTVQGGTALNENDTNVQCEERTNIVESLSALWCDHATIKIYRKRNHPSKVIGKYRF